MVTENNPNIDVLVVKSFLPCIRMGFDNQLPDGCKMDIYGCASGNLKICEQIAKNSCKNANIEESEIRVYYKNFINKSKEDLTKLQEHVLENCASPNEIERMMHFGPYGIGKDINGITKGHVVQLPTSLQISPLNYGAADCTEKYKEILTLQNKKSCLDFIMGCDEEWKLMSSEGAHEKWETCYQQIE